MSTEAEKILLQDEFEEVMASNDDESLHNFLDEQNISDVADLIYENDNQEAYILSRLSIHRAAGLFKILEHPTQEKIIQELSGLYGGKIHKLFKRALKGYSVEMPAAQAEKLSQDARVKYVEEDSEVFASAVSMAAHSDDGKRSRRPTTLRRTPFRASLSVSAIR